MSIAPELFFRAEMVRVLRSCLLNFVLEAERERGALVNVANGKRSRLVACTGTANAEESTRTTKAPSWLVRQGLDGHLSLV